ncbi:MAG TPA: LamG-like jellyroll fold domain-containing protein, partial [Verrucomicrobiae bacterium]|nr:LamG-like jellyroll fold domain-containing protein [Verrucomicrobiae bacterium]
SNVRLTPLLPGLLLAFALHCELHAQDASLLVDLNFDEDFSSGQVIDVTGNGHDGWCFNPTNWITATQGVFATIGGYWQTNSTLLEPPSTYIPVSQYFGITNLNGIRYLTNATVSLWVQFRQNTPQAVWVISNGRDAQYLDDQSGTNGWDFAKVYSSSMQFLVYPLPGGYSTVLTWPTPVDTSYHLYTATVDCNANRAVAYYDGLPVQTNAVGVPFLQVYGSAPVRWLCVGKLAMQMPPGPMSYDGNYAAGFFEGRIDDVRIYNRVLSSGEAEALYIGNTFARNLVIQGSSASSVRLGWDAVSNATYQVEYMSNLNATAWSALGMPLEGSLTNSTTDSPLASSRFYRVRVLP